MKKPLKKQDPKTSWETSSGWYDRIVGDQGHYYHERIILPKVLALLGLTNSSSLSLLDLCCGQGILAKKIPPLVKYVGVDAAPSLIRSARQSMKSHPERQAEFLVGDATAPLKLDYEAFTHGSIILALQNLDKPDLALMNFKKHLQKQAPLILVLNHPCFRIPRQSAWGFDEDKKLQYRRMDRYMGELKIPIATHPGKGQTSEQTVSFHFPLQKLASMLKTAGFLIEDIQEWCSDKASEGKMAAAENRARKEFPLFLCVVARKW